MGTAILLLILGAGTTYTGYKIIDNRRKYEFKNRTDGGVVKFKDWQATKKHHAIMKSGKAIGSIGVLIFFAGIFIIIMMVNK